MSRKLGAGARGLNSPAHWIDCQHADNVSFGKEPTCERGGRNVDARPQTSLEAGLTRVSEHSYCGMFYELTVGEPSKLHLTTRIVTSSSKLSPQKSAATL